MNSPKLLLALICLSPIAFASVAAEVGSSRGAELYAQECSKCHGQLSTSSSAAARRARFIRVARVEVDASREAVAFAMPYGPTLRGIIGRIAGSVPDFDYSKAFLSEFRGVIWDEALLDEYIADTQKRAPGVRMFYRQPDPEIRRSIIDFLASSP